ncbi:hypothetical protein ERY430_60224 [Erythrobacter sp. EC-HK427]|nr:hypothetical protein ERY430_60224 [Erythrobacter sp. EC-HK427]
MNGRSSAVSCWFGCPAHEQPRGRGVEGGAGDEERDIAEQLHFSAGVVEAQFDGHFHLDFADGHGRAARTLCRAFGDFAEQGGEGAAQHHGVLSLAGAGATC